VRCTGCEFDNREGRKFCASCGLALPATCPECGHTNEGGDRYCGGCGRLLADTGVTPPVEGRSEAPEGDRRPVSVLFCDLVGYTRLSSELDPEDVHALLERFFTLVDAVVDRFGGTIDKHIGDAAMALFGAPVAHGNDAERAVRAAMQIHASLSELNSSPPLTAHIGVATGEVVASSVGSQSHRRYNIAGDERFSAGGARQKSRGEVCGLAGDSISAMALAADRTCDDLAGCDADMRGKRRR